MSELRTGVDLPGVPAERAIAAFTDPDVLRAWWGGELFMADGMYVVNFEHLGRVLTGRVLAHDPAAHLAFSWQWDGEGKAFRVDVRADGGRLELTHGPYTPADADERTAHIAGWAFFLPRLAKTLLTP
ncbi:hypothetical protein Lfu02_49040 [Longispora fulva]|uniref:Uncharacterized protein YndB with AHSA1/START domain n=1 Tax=Longispora fulva TaxID=619741 RepID=A0A8J7GHT6_9ACTN|nr:SRPBCC domain-containing protein [Longispora fulva]MBG6138281.1 uncharacterized protein YndB with AHSA1/START domain [Longispora fulva]GIG60532.1 hypothetical protein Lfu02_49040 [Longispora fulva]